jgi:hypothetical protein
VRCYVKQELKGERVEEPSKIVLAYTIRRGGKSSKILLRITVETIVSVLEGSWELE